MNRISKKSFTDITVFYPDSIKDKLIEYEPDLDYDSEVLSSKFTQELSSIYVDYILDNLGEETGKVFAWGLQISHIPLLIELLSREDVALVFAFTRSEDCIDMISAVLTLLGLANKCSIVKSINVKITGLTGIIYIGIDQLPYKISTDKTTFDIGGLVLIKTIDNELLKLTATKKMTLDIKEFKNSSISVQVNGKAKYPSEDEIDDYQTIESSEYERPKIEKKKPATKITWGKENKYSKVEEKKQVTLPVKSEKEKVWFTQTLEKESTTKPGSQISESIMKGDKYQEVRKVDLRNANKGHPEKGGWIQIDKGVQNFYLFGAEELPSPSPKVDRNLNKFRSDLANYIIQLIEIFNPLDDFDVKKMVSDEYIDLWLQTWTHESFDIDENYETLETVGDAGFAYCFLSFLYRKFPDIDRAELTFVKANIGGKKSLRQVGWALKMDEWLRMGTGTRSNTNTSEDIVEAFCATLQIVTNDIFFKLREESEEEGLDIGPGIGILMINAFVNFLFDTVEFTQEMFLGDSKTTLLQSVQGIAQGEEALEEEYEESETHLHKMTLYWSQTALSFFSANEYPMKRLIAKTEAKSKKAASDKLYTLATDNLKIQGYSISWLKNIKNQIKMAQFDQDTVKAVMKKVKKQHGDKAVIKFYIPRTLNTLAGVTVELQAIVPDGSRKGKIVRLASETNSSGDATIAKAKVLEKYLSMK